MKAHDQTNATSSTARSILALLLASSIAAFAAPPDLTTGGVPGDSVTINLGPTGMRGWVYHNKVDTGESRQIQVNSVASGSPAVGFLAANDVILGANGTGATPVNFSADARKSLALAIADAEARNPAILKLRRWRAGTTTTVTLTLQTLGAYSATAPYNCPKSAEILKRGLEAIMTGSGETAGRYSFGVLSLIAAQNTADPNNAARMARAQTEARALVPSAATMQQMMSDQRDATSMVTWERGHELIALAEYYLATGDAQVLPAIEANAVNIAKNSSLFGTMGHIFAEKNPDGSANGPMGGVYGPVNSTGMPCFLGLLLAKECGITHASISPVIDRMNRFYAYYSGRGAVPYGEHEAYWQAHESNGKCGLAALCFTLQSSRVEEGKFFAKITTAAASEREIGHTGSFFNYLWSPLGAACGGEVAAASQFSRISWMLDLNRRWDGKFDYDCLYGEGPDSGATYNDFRMSTAALLTYALPLRQLRITGKSHSSARWLTATDVTQAVAADGYNPTPRTISQLIADLGNWSPMVQRKAADQLATRTMDSATITTLTSLANNPSGTSRIGACLALGKVIDSSSANARAATLAALLAAPENHVRFMAAEGMRYLPQTARLTQLNAVLSATASTAKPLLPFDEEDPLHFAHGRLAMLLFHGGGSNFGPKGIIWDNLTGVDRNLLYPAIRAVAANPVGLARSTLSAIYPLLTKNDTLAVADSVVDSVAYVAPSDRMFSFPIRLKGFDLMWKYDIADGVAAGLKYIVEATPSNRTAALNVLEKFGASHTTVTPEPDVIGTATLFLTPTDGSAEEKAAITAAAQAVLNAVAADTNPTPLTALKSIGSISADSTSITLPARQTVLRATGFDYANGDSVYTWRKVSGNGTVTFTPNGTASAKNCAILLSGQPGQYLFEVTMSDSRGFTEVSATIPVTLADAPINPPPPLPGVITWEVPSNTTGPASVATTGTWVGSRTGDDTSGTITVNGVNFSQGRILTRSGSFLDTICPDTDNANAALESLLDRISWSGNSFQLTGLTAGADYLVQLFLCDYRVTDRLMILGDNASPQNIAILNSNPAGAFGQYVTGAFTASGTSQTITIAALSGDAHINAWQVRRLPDDKPPTPNPMSFASAPAAVSSTSVTMTAAAASDPSGVEYYFQETTGNPGGTSSVWQSSPTYTDNGLMPGVLYTYTVKARDASSNQNATASSAPASATPPPKAAGVITWGPATHTTSPANISTFGTPVSSCTGDNTSGTITVNGVAFSQGSILINPGAFFDTICPDTGAGTDNAALESLLDRISWGSSSFQLSGLTAGANYLVQVFLCDYRVTSRQMVLGDSAAPPNTVTLTANPVGAFGQFVTGSFIASGTTQSISVTAVSGSAHINSWQVRRLPDQTPPTPNPMSFASAPAAGSPTSIAMTASAASDSSGVEYSFEETTGNTGGSDSGWQTSASYTDHGLLPSLTYSYRVRARDKSSNANTTAWSTVASATTAAAPSGAVYWNQPADITGVTDVSTNGTLTASYTGHNANGNVIVNGVTFSQGRIPNANNSGADIGTRVPSTGNASYDTLLRSISWNYTGGNVTLSGLTAGANYEIQIWAADNVETPAGMRSLVLSHGTGYAVSLVYEPLSGAPGQFTTGYFTATGTTQDFAMITFNYYGQANQVQTGSSITNALQVRRMSAPAQGMAAAPIGTGSGQATGYTTWADRYAPANLADPAADHDGDGMSNNAEWAFGLDPTSGASANPISVTLSPVDGTFSYIRRDPTLTGLTYTVRTSTTLGDWTEDAGAIQTPGTPDENGVQTVAVALSPGLLANPALFVRVCATAPVK